MIRTPLIILAGGLATRMGKTCTLVAKCALPVYNTTLILRQVEQASRAGYKKIIISTNTIAYPQLNKLFEDFDNIELVENPAHEFGSLAALLNILKRINERKVLMSFADIYFLENPFGNTIKFLDLENIYLFVAEAAYPKELEKGGIIWSNANSEVTKIQEAPLPGNSQGFRWTGLSLFNTSFSKELESFLATNSNTPEEEFFAYLLAKGGIIKIVLTCDFLNVNNPTQLFLASLYKAIEENHPNKELQESLVSSANLLRKSLLEVK